MNTIISFLCWVSIGIAVVGGLLLVGLLANILLFPDMWRQDDLPKWIKWLTSSQN